MIIAEVHEIVIELLPVFLRNDLFHLLFRFHGGDPPVLLRDVPADDSSRDVTRVFASFIFRFLPGLCPWLVQVLSMKDHFGGHPDFTVLDVAFF